MYAMCSPCLPMDQFVILMLKSSINHYLCIKKRLKEIRAADQLGREFNESNMVCVQCSESVPGNL